MAAISQIRGIMLEEALLYLLRGTGYQTVEKPGNDPTLKIGPAGMIVKGRGGNHQIDAIADFLVHHPFSHPQRLLVEAKCFSPNHPVGLPIARNAVGVLKDVNEFWFSSSPASIGKKRYHYQYALFSASGYTSDAEEYAYAQDIFLIPLTNSIFFKPIIGAIRGISKDDFRAKSNAKIDIDLSELRRRLRESLTYRDIHDHFYEDYRDFRRHMEEFLSECARIQFSLLAVIGRNFPIFLVPDPSFRMDILRSPINVRIYWDDSNWYLKDAQNRTLFSFDLPKTLFNLYAEEGILTERQALNMKEEIMSDFYAFQVVDGSIKVVNFRLDFGWIERIRKTIARRQG